jgi:hypothetical protein
MMRSWSWKTATWRRPSDITNIKTMISCIPLLQNKGPEQRRRSWRVQQWYCINKLSQTKNHQALTNCNTNTIHIPVKKNIHMLRSIKGKLGMKISSIYCSPCRCGKAYLRQVGRSIKTRCKKRVTHTCVGQIKKSVTA